MVVRCFEDENVIHVEGGADPERDIEIIGIEMGLADLASLAKRLEKLEREARMNSKLVERLEAAKRLKAALEDGNAARSFGPDTVEADIARELFLLTAKPLFYVANVDEGQLAEPGPLAQRVYDLAKAEGNHVVTISSKIEAELAGMSDDEAAEFIADLGISSGALDKLVVTAYDLLGLMTFLTAGEQEVRAWTIHKGTKAPAAAGQIHSDIERGFIRAEIVSYDDYARLKTMDAIRKDGLLRSEGKEYVMQEGDVVNFRFNV
jgi:GTP-binding protein YchF